MKNTYTNKLTVALLAVSLGFLSSTAFASKEDIQSRASEQIYKLQQQIKAAEASINKLMLLRQRNAKSWLSKAKNASWP